MKARRRFLPIEDVKVGMTLVNSAFAVERGLLGLQFPSGMVLTQDSIDQLVAHRAEFVEVDEPDLRTDEQVAEDERQIEGEVERIFHGADPNLPQIAALQTQVLAYRRCT